MRISDWSSDVCSSDLIPNPLTRTADKAGVIGAIVTAMGCAACFPALASLGAAIGLGFLSQYEGVFIRYLLPLFAVLALLANVIGGLRHRQWPRMLLGSEERRVGKDGVG